MESGSCTPAVGRHGAADKPTQLRVRRALAQARYRPRPASNRLSATVLAVTVESNHPEHAVSFAPTSTGAAADARIWRIRGFLDRSAASPAFVLAEAFAAYGVRVAPYARDRKLLPAPFRPALTAACLADQLRGRPSPTLSRESSLAGFSVCIA